jgi:hypothetical protein
LAGLHYEKVASPDGFRLQDVANDQTYMSTLNDVIGRFQESPLRVLAFASLTISL